MKRITFFVIALLGMFMLTVPASSCTMSFGIFWNTGCLPSGWCGINLTPTDGLITVTRSANGGKINVTFTKPNNPGYWWRAQVWSASDGATALVPGSYPNAVNDGRRHDNQPGLMLRGASAFTCYENLGSFVIEELTINPDGSVATLWLRGDQWKCFNNPDGRFEIKYNLGCAATPTLSRSWGQLKSVYR